MRRPSCSTDRATGSRLPTPCLTGFMRSSARALPGARRPYMVAEKSADGMLTVGIDLGTSRSAISTSTGERIVADSFVGWPADLVARKILKRDVLVGKDALEHRTMLDLRRPLERGLIKEGSDKDIQAVRELIGHLMQLLSKKGSKDHSSV